MDEHSLHSPFVYDLYTKVIKSSNTIIKFPEYESLRQELKKDHTLIPTSTFGAESTINKKPEREISNIAGEGISDQKCSQLFYSLGNYFGSKVVLELGTSLGLNSLYLSSIPDAQVTTMEGCEQTLQIATQHFDRFQKKNIIPVAGNIDSSLPDYLGKIRHIDLVFFDANHRYEPTINYFEQLLRHTHASSLFIFDDIHWSPDMKQAWIEITSHPLSRVSMDLFQIGLVFFDPELPKQKFILEF